MPNAVFGIAFKIVAGIWITAWVSVYACALWKERQPLKDGEVEISWGEVSGFAGSGDEPVFRAKTAAVAITSTREDPVPASLHAA